jgi:hypothetical protein
LDAGIPNPVGRPGAPLCIDDVGTLPNALSQPPIDELSAAVDGMPEDEVEPSAFVGDKAPFIGEPADEPCC